MDRSDGSAVRGRAARAGSGGILDSGEASRAERYSDIAGISSSGPFQLTVTTFEQARSHYGDRKEFNFQLKQPIPETRYNQLWMDIERKSGRIQ